MRSGECRICGRQDSRVFGKVAEAQFSLDRSETPDVEGMVG